jgi:hypothetical protein
MFWASRIRYHKYGSGSSSGSGSGSFDHQAKIAKNLDFFCFSTSYFLAVIRIRMFLGIPDPHPDPLVRSTDPRIRIRISGSIGSGLCFT